MSDPKDDRLPWELSDAEKDMTMEEYEAQEEKLPHLPERRDVEGNALCGECGSRMGGPHPPTCKVHNKFRKWYRKILHESEKANYTPRPDSMCSGCDQPKDGLHRFGCSLYGARAGQVVLPVSRKEGDTFSAHLPENPKPNKG